MLKYCPECKTPYSKEELEETELIGAEPLCCTKCARSTEEEDLGKKKGTTLIQDQNCTLLPNATTL